MIYTGKSKTLKALSEQSGGGVSASSLPLNAGEVETWKSGSVTVEKMMIGVVSVTIKSADLTTNIKTCNGKIAGYFCGHQHLDMITTCGNRFKQVTLMCDKFSNVVYYPQWQIPQRVANTASEQALTIVHINPTTKRVEFTRIGAQIEGQIYSFNYT